MKDKETLTLVAAALFSALLWGFAYMPNLFFLLGFVAFVPLLIAMKRSSLNLGIILAFAAALPALLIADNSLWNRASIPELIITLIIQLLFFALPWVMYQLIRLRHNEKLGYVALVSSWLSLEWFAAQFFGLWSGLQLGFGPAYFPVIVQWYSFLGATAGTLWILAINIHISRIIMPTKSYTRRSAGLNGAAILLLPICVSLFWPVTKNPLTISTTVLQKDNNNVLISSNQEILEAKAADNSTLWYRAGTDTLKFAQITDISGNNKAIGVKTIWTDGIAGKSSQFLTLCNFDGIKCGLINASSLVRTETVRLYAAEKANLLIAYAAPTDINLLMLRSRALENRFNILTFSKDGSARLLSSYGEIIQLNDSINTVTGDAGFFALYGDLIGRLSIFVSIWLVLGTIVKPFRKR